MHTWSTMSGTSTLRGSGALGPSVSRRARPRREQLVDRLVHSLRGLGRVEVEERMTTSESVQFKLPKEVRA